MTFNLKYDKLQIISDYKIELSNVDAWSRFLTYITLAASLFTVKNSIGLRAGVNTLTDHKGDFRKILPDFGSGIRVGID